MKSTWTRDLPRETEADQRALIEFAAECGFDTVITEDVTHAMADRGDEIGVDAVEIVEPYPTEEFQESHPDALQQMRPVEAAMAEVLADASFSFGRSAFRWYPPVHDRPFLCFEHPASRTFLRDRIEDALDAAHGVALDGFGFRNQYACFCDRCREARAGATDEDEDELAVLARTAEESLVEISEDLYDHAKSVDPDAVVTNHTWPPFRPNPTYAHRLHLDYCSQTISWFYPPAWPLDRVEFEAATHARLADRNEYVPFVGMHADPSLLRSPERLARELDIALEYGDGSLSFSRLKTLERHDDLRAVFQDALS